MTAVFWLSALLLAYIYLGYPLLLKCLPKKPIKADKSGGYQPSVTLLIPAYNEADVIEATIQNKLAQDYPRDKLEIIVISDESDDGTDEIVRRLAEEDIRIRLLRQSPRQGKTAGLNRAIEQAIGEILVFSDANSQFGDQALAKLVACFADPEVGYATGKMVYVNQEGNLVGDGCSAYMRYENHLRRLESQVGSVVGVDGGIDAMRRELYQPMNPDQLPDFVQPLKVVAQGKRVVYQDQALLQEESLSDSDSEFRMRVRVSLRAMWALWDMRQLFDPLRYGLFSIQLMSHKLLRYLAFVPLLSVALTSLVLVDSHWVYALTALAQIVFYALAAYAAVSPERQRGALCKLAFYFSLINFAALVASLKFLKGDKIVTWKPRGG